MEETHIRLECHNMAYDYESDDDIEPVNANTNDLPEFMTSFPRQTMRQAMRQIMQETTEQPVKPPAEPPIEPLIIDLDTIKDPRAAQKDVYIQNTRGMFEHQCPPKKGCNRGHITRQYLMRSVQKPLVEGMRLIDQERPPNPRQWFGEFLLMYNAKLHNESVNGVCVIDHTNDAEPKKKKRKKKQ